jgi:NFU1 iron-sulfur cluster scaffold homolog, mitochondrial
MKIVEIEYTPNPNAVKFILDEALTMMGQSAEFHTAEEAAGVSLAQKLFAIDHVISIYYTDRWLTITQSGDADWYDLLRVLAEPIREATVDDARLGLEEAIAARVGEGGEGVGLDDERIPQIQELMSEHIMPYLQGDGGGLEIKGLVDNQLMIRYQGACGTCPSASMGTLMAIENLVQMEVDPELEVISV